MVTFRSRDTTPVQLTHHGVANLPGSATMQLYGEWRGEEDASGGQEGPCPSWTSRKG